MQEICTMTQPNPLTLAAEARERATRTDWLGLAAEQCPSDIIEWGRNHGIPTFAQLTWCAGYSAGAKAAAVALSADLAASRAEVERLRAGWFRMMQFDSECAPETHFGKRCEGKDTCRCAEEMDEWMAPAKFPIPDPAP